MTLEELEADAKNQAAPQISYETCEKPTHSGHVFLMEDESGHVRYMTTTEDGRIIPIEDWWD